MARMESAHVSGSVITQPSVTVDIITKDPEDGATIMGENGNGVVVGGWNLGSAVYDNISFNAGIEGHTMGSIAFSADGINMYTLDSDDDMIFQYLLTTGWDISTASYTGKSADITTEDTSMFGMFISDDGSKVFTCGTVTDDVFAFNLITPFDISTLSSVASYPQAEDGQILGIYLKEDGLKMWVVGQATLRVHEYDLGTPWDLSTASYNSIFLDVSNETTVPVQIFVRPNGLSMYLIDATSNTGYQYTLTSPWDLSTASYSGISFDFSSQDTFPNGLYLKIDDGTKVFISGTTKVNPDNEIFQYTLTD